MDRRCGHSTMAAGRVLASRWRTHGIPAVCFGPQPELASGSDDYVNEQDVVDCAKIYALAALAYLNG
jgi:succinyl-diaminopimelate desuccinylase